MIFKTRKRTSGWTGKHLSYVPGTDLHADLFPVQNGRVTTPSVVLGVAPRHCAERTPK